MVGTADSAQEQRLLDAIAGLRAELININESLKELTRLYKPAVVNVNAMDAKSVMAAADAISKDTMQSGKSIRPTVQGNKR